MILFGYFREKRKHTPYRFRKFSFFYYDFTKKNFFQRLCSISAKRANLLCSRLTQSSSAWEKPYGGNYFSR